MRLFPLYSFLALFLASTAIFGEEDKKCKDATLVNLVEENCTLIKKLTGNEEGCKGYEEMLKVCASPDINDEQLKTLREPMEKANAMLRGATSDAKEMQQAQQKQSILTS